VSKATDSVVPSLKTDACERDQPMTTEIKVEPDAASPLQPGALETLPPAYFALVMATGIVSIAAHLLGLEMVSRVLLVANPFFYGVLCLLFIARALLYPAAFWRDFANPMRGVGFFTLVASTAVLGTQLAIEAQALRAAAWLWLFACLLYVVLIYGVFATLTVHPDKPDMRHSLNGTWLVAIVATQGLSILGGTVYHSFPGFERGILFISLALWLAGGVLYIWIMGIIFSRYMFQPLEPAELGPPYWVDMGAVAISTLAGVTLIGNLGAHPVLTEIGPFIKGGTILFWSAATWWIPMLLLLGFWRHIYRRFPLRYDPSYWALVFPLGMYTVCTFKMAHALDLPELEAIPQIVVWPALFAWALTFAGMLHSMARTLTGK